jgi:hypothetical protein
MNKNKMKRNSMPMQAVEPDKAIHGIALGEQWQNELQLESSLSPERTMAGASATTTLLSQILAQSQQSRPLPLRRHFE